MKKLMMNSLLTSSSLPFRSKEKKPVSISLERMKMMWMICGTQLLQQCKNLHPFLMIQVLIPINQRNEKQRRKRRRRWDNRFSLQFSKKL